MIDLSVRSIDPHQENHLVRNFENIPVAHVHDILHLHLYLLIIRSIRVASDPLGPTPSL